LYRLPGNGKARAGACAIVEKLRRWKEEFRVGDAHISPHYNLLAAAPKAYNKGSPISIAGTAHIASDAVEHFVETLR
jgi:hypothetical protein